eukprot:jgi/Tetstr1/442091/TSEL_003174.t1
MLPPSEDAPPPHPSVATKAGAIQCASPAVLNTLMARVAALEEAAEGRTMLPAKVDKLERQVKDLKARMQKMQAQFAEASPSHGTSSGHPDPVPAAKALAGKEVIGIYFSAHFCPPCRSLTPRLAKQYAGLRHAGKKFEIIWASADRSQQEFYDYFGEMPWLAVPFDSRHRSQLMQRYGVHGIPRLILVDASGQLISNNAGHTLLAPTYISDFPYHSPARPAGGPHPDGPSSGAAITPAHAHGGGPGAPPTLSKGTRRALLVGCCYPGSQSALHGCWNDAKTMRALLIKYFKFPAGNITTLLDKPGEAAQPTGANIKRELRKLVQSCQPGDVAVFSFSGHGTQMPFGRRHGGKHQEDDGRDEAIVPSDHNIIVDDDLRLIMEELKPGVQFTAVCDCCHSENLLDHQRIDLNLSKKPPRGAGAPGGSALPSMHGPAGAGGTTHQIFINGQPVQLPPDMMAQVLSGGQLDPSALMAILSSAANRAISPQQLAFALNVDDTGDGLM